MILDLKLNLNKAINFLNTYNEIMLFEYICLFQLVVIKVDTVEACLASLQYAGTTLEGLKKERHVEARLCR